VPIYSIQATVTAATSDGALDALQIELKKRIVVPGPPDKTGLVKAYQCTEWVSGVFTLGTSAPTATQYDT
jgi:hypothetical protein